MRGAADVLAVHDLHTESVEAALVEQWEKVLGSREGPRLLLAGGTQLLQKLGPVVDAGERVVDVDVVVPRGLFGEKTRWRDKGVALLALTDRNLILVLLTSAPRSFPVAAVTGFHLQDDSRVGIVTAQGELLVDAMPISGTQGLTGSPLLARLVELPWNEAITESGQLSIRWIGPFTLYPDRLEGGSTSFPLARSVKAEVQTAGDFAITVDRLKGTGVRLGPVGLFSGRASQVERDLRELYLLIEGPDWAVAERFPPDQGLLVRQFVQDVNLAARQYPSQEPPSAPLAEPSTTDRLHPLERLGALRDAGVLTDEEFQAEKQRILSS
jgi:hypothetical protein